MKHTTVCYIEENGKYLLLHRTKKKNDDNEGKWIGIGGKLEQGESPFDCVKREVREETGLNLTSVRYRGFITFVSDIFGTEYMHLFTADKFDGESIKECEEGELAWISKDKLDEIPMWEGDKIFLDLLETESQFFSLKFNYIGDSLVSYKIDK